MYGLCLTSDVARDLKRLKRRDQNVILDALDVHLRNQPTRPTRRRKILVNLQYRFPIPRPLWQLRVGVYRVFYDVDEAEKTVTILAVREKPPHKTTEEIL